MRKQLRLRLGLAVLIVAIVVLAGCQNNVVTPNYEFDGKWVDSFLEVWEFSQTGGLYGRPPLYGFDFIYTSVDEASGKILLQVTSTSGLPPAYIKTGASVYVMYVVSGDQMNITFNQGGYVTPTSSDGPFTLQ